MKFLCSTPFDVIRPFLSKMSETVEWKYNKMMKIIIVMRGYVTQKLQNIAVAGATPPTLPLFHYVWLQFMQPTTILLQHYK